MPTLPNPPPRHTPQEPHRKVPSHPRGSRNASHNKKGGKKKGLKDLSSPANAKAFGKPGLSEKSVKSNLDSKGKSAHRNADVQATALPDPIPADEDATSVLKPATGTTMSIPPTATPVVVANSVFSQLIVSSITSVIATTTVWETPPGSIAATADTLQSTGSTSATSSTSSSRLPVFVVVLLAFGSTSLAISACLLITCLFRGERRIPLPTPSAPILQDSPLFGGKERLSRGLLGDPSFGNLRFSANKSASLLRSSKGDGWRPLNGIAVSDSSSEKTLRPPENAFVIEKMPVPSPASVYPATPTTAAVVALDTYKQSTKVTKPLRPARKDVPTSATNKTKRMSGATSMYGGAEISSPTFTETMIAYQTPRPAPSPGRPKPALKPATASREQQTHGSIKRNNSTSTSQGAVGVNSRRQSATLRILNNSGKEEEPFMYTIPSVKSQERRDRDTQALTTALGLASPTIDGNNRKPLPLSSCFSPVSIYPEDSLSVKNRSSAYRSEMPSPTSMSATLGNFMLQDFPSQATFNSFRSSTHRNSTNDPFAAGELTLGASTKKKGTYDRNEKPPRVPSPPPLPSLAQMALANADPDYRSPTYSIYGMYEPSRKSKASFAGEGL